MAGKIGSFFKTNKKYVNMAAFVILAGGLVLSVTKCSTNAKDRNETKAAYDDAIRQLDSINHVSAASDSVIRVQRDEINSLVDQLYDCGSVNDSLGQVVDSLGTALTDCQNSKKTVKKPVKRKPQVTNPTPAPRKNPENKPVPRVGEKPVPEKKVEDKPRVEPEQTQKPCEVQVVVTNTTVNTVSRYKGKIYR